MAKEQQLTVCDKLLISGYALEERGRCPFTAEDLVIEAWQQFPNTFGLSGHKNHDDGNLSYPDSNRVFAEIMGSKPIRKKGLLVKVGIKMYELTELGRHLAVIINGNHSDKDSKSTDVGKAGLSREVESQLKRLIGSRAVQKVDNENQDAITFHDACLFWGITPQSSAIEFEGRLARLESVLRVAKDVLRGGVAHYQHRGEGFSTGTLDLVERTHNDLRDRFQPQIGIINRRTDQRRYG